jgi:hypothetical protein
LAAAPPSAQFVVSAPVSQEMFAMTPPASVPVVLEQFSDTPGPYLAM